MAKNKISLQFKGFEEYAERLDKLGGDLKATTEKALQNSHDYITPKVRAAMNKHHRTGETEDSIAGNAKVVWEGSVASIDIGFNLTEGGMPSIFLMYGTPRMKKDQALYDSIYGNRTKKAIKELQEKTFARAIKKAMGG
jgi:hypothetical protein